MRHHSGQMTRGELDMYVDKCPERSCLSYVE